MDLTCQQFFISVRLVGGRHSCEGRIELFDNGQWSTVCDTNWSAKEAKVACAMANCPT